MTVKPIGRWFGWLALLLTSGSYAAAPLLTLEPPPSLTNARTILIRGVTASGCDVLVSLGGQTARLRTGADGGFEVGPLELAEGLNTLVITATLGAESSRYSSTIAADRQAPPLRLDTPWDAGSPAAAAPQPLIVRGVTEPGCTVGVQFGEREFAAVPAGADGTFELQLLGEMPDGVQPFEVIARDPAGNETRMRRELAVDATPPRLTIDRPLDADLSSAAREVSLTGLVEPGAQLRVRLNEQALLLTSITEEGRFALLRLPLQPGDNLLVLEAVDAVGNKTYAVRKIVYDIAAPDLYLASPLDLPVYRTALPVVRVVGQAEPGSRITLRTDAGETRDLQADDHGRFDGGVVLLAEGTTGLTWTARDPAGNVTVLRRWVSVDRQPPPIQLTSPGPLAYVESDRLHLAGRTEPGALLVLRRGADEQRVVADARGAFAFDGLELLDGRNALVLTATDALGNARILPIDVAARLQPLWLQLTEPEEGWQSATPTRVALVTEADALLSATLDGATLEPWRLAPPLLADEPPWRAGLLNLPELAAGPHVLKVDAWSPSGLRKATIRRAIHVPGTPRSLLLWTEDGPESGSRVVRATAFDEWDMPVADGTIIEVRAPDGWLVGDREAARLRTVHGEVTAVLQPVRAPRRGVVLVSVGRITESVRLSGR